MKGTIQLSIALAMYLFLIHSHISSAQEVRYRGVISLTSGSFKGRTFVKAFKQDSILIETKVLGKNIYIDQFLPAHQVARVTVYSKVNHGKGAVKGTVIGLGIIVFSGLISAFSSSEESFDYTSILIAPLPIMIGLIGGSRKSKKFILNGNIEAYNNQREEMQYLLTQ